MQYKPRFTMTMAEWDKLIPVPSQQHPNGLRYVSVAAVEALADEGAGRWNLFHLKDWRVCSVASGTYWLMREDS